MNLFDIEDLKIVPAVRDMTVSPVTTKDVIDFCRRYHYTTTGGSMPWRYGLWYGPTVLGVVAYNLPTRDACQAVFGPEHYDKVWHMGRLALADTAPCNSESRLIAGSLQIIARDHPETWAVLTYAATDAGHIGYVYQATNALYTGTGGDGHHFIDQNGKPRANHTAGGRIPLARAAAWGWTRVADGPKHRYVYILGNKRQRRERRALLKYPVLPYPKAMQATYTSAGG